MTNSDMSRLEGYDDCVSLRHAALGLLAKEPGSGYDLLKKFKSTMHPVWPATQSQLYGELNKLASAGFTKVSDVGARGRKEYAITDAGRAELHRWMTSPDEDPPQRSAVLLRVFLLGELTPSEARQYIESLRDWVEQELRSYEEIRDSNDWSDNDKTATSSPASPSSICCVPPGGMPTGRIGSSTNWTAVSRLCQAAVHALTYPGPSLAAASSGTSTSLIGVASSCARALRMITPLRMSHSIGR